jgi:hypothetical protein
MRATVPDRLPTGASQAIGKHLRDRSAGPASTPAFMPKRHSELSGNRRRRLDNAVRPEIGYLWVPGLGAARVAL